MPQYYVNTNAQTNGDHEVHTDPCPYPPNVQSRVDLGWHTSCFGAVASAKQRWPNARINGCYYCCNACHTT
jgi:hypothetical protein